MSQQITIQVSDQVVRHAARMAAQSQQRMEQVLESWLEQTLAEMPIEALADEDILALTELQLAPERQATLNELLTRNRENALDAAGRHQLDELMRVYECGLLRKAQALRVAVQRGLRDPLQP